jgi:hypothetical protein
MSQVQLKRVHWGFPLYGTLNPQRRSSFLALFSYKLPSVPGPSLGSRDSKGLELQVPCLARCDLGLLACDHQLFGLLPDSFKSWRCHL